jgi:hypothetical protein
MTDAPDYLRADDITRLTGVSLRTVRRWIRDFAVSESARHAVGAQEAPRTNALSPTGAMVRYQRGNARITMTISILGKR